MKNKRFRSLLCVLLALCMLSALVGCSAPAESGEPPVNTTAAPSGETPDAAPSQSPDAEEIAAETTDVVVIGAGGAGLIAASTLNNAGRKVVLLEKRAMTGGNTALAGFFAAADTKMHQEFGVDYTVEDHYNFLMGTEGTGSEFARMFAENAGSTAEWLVDTLGITVTNVVGREIYAVDENGTKLPNQAVTRLTQKIQEEGVDLRLESPATGLIVEDGKVVGVEVTGAGGTYRILADAVLIASGGFAANQEMLAQYAPEWTGSSTSNTSATVGDGILMAQKAGAAVSNMDQLTINPTFYDNNGTTMSVSGVRYEGGILVDYDGNRFTNEMQDYSAVARDEIEKAGGRAYAIMDANSLGCNPAYCVSADTVEGLAGQIGMDPAVLQATLARYQGFYDGSADEDFGRTDMRSRLDTAPYYAVPVFWGVHHTRGGLSINLRGQVLREDGSAIEGLYAAGEVTDNKLLGSDPVAAGFTFGRLTAGSVLEDLN